MTSIKWFRRAGLERRATTWLRKNPPPANWQAGRFDWAYTEMPIWPWQKWRTRKIPKPAFDWPQRS